MTEQISDDTEFVVDSSKTSVPEVSPSETMAAWQPGRVCPDCGVGEILVQCQTCGHPALTEGCPNCLSEEVARLRIVLRTARSLGTLFEVQTFIDAELDED